MRRSSGAQSAGALRRILGTPTAWLVGMGVAIGSGVFRTPGEVAAALPTPGWIIVAWVLGGVIVLLQGFVTAELATRFPRAGGEYVYIREAYGEAAGYFFGWTYTLFVIGAGAGTIAAAAGDFICQLLDWPALVPVSVGAVVWEVRVVAPIVVLVVAGVNAIGLRTGAIVQNVLTMLKIVALLAIVVLGLVWGDGADGSFKQGGDAVGFAWPAFAGAVMLALWSYAGTTDAAKLAEEVDNVNRALPRALIGSALSLIGLYVLLNLALLRVMSPEGLAQHALPHAELARRMLGATGERLIIIVAIVVTLGSLHATLLATIRVPFALARDGLAFGFLQRMNNRQSPAIALFSVALLAAFLASGRDFTQVLTIYFFAATILFGLTYAALLIFRLRDRRAGRSAPAGMFRCPGAEWQVGFLVLLNVGLLVYAVRQAPWDALRSLLVMVAILLSYYGWRMVKRARRGADVDAS